MKFQKLVFHGLNKSFCFYYNIYNSLNNSQKQLEIRLKSKQSQFFWTLFFLQNFNFDQLKGLYMKDL